MDRKKLYMIAGGALALFLIIVIASSQCGGSSVPTKPVASVEGVGDEHDAAQPVATPDAAAVEPPPPPPVDAAEVIEIVDAGTKAVVPDAAVKVVTPPPPKPPKPPDPPPQPKPNAGELTQNGLRELAMGNYGVAAGLFRKATAADPRHAAAWRGLGVTYEKVKANAQAISAFQRYLALAPGAGDAAAIKERIEKLKTP